MKKVTIKQLSEILDVSISTVSKALNNSYEISESTKKRIVEAAELHGYSPNPIARRLKYGKTYTIGVILPTIQDNFFVRVLHGIEEEVYKTEYNIITCSTRNIHSKEVELVKSLSGGIVDGFIIAPAKETIVKQDFRHFNEALKMEKKIVMFDRIIDSIPCNTVESDNVNAVFHATQQLIRKGKNRIALVTSNSTISTGKHRIKGYLKALDQNGFDYNTDLIFKDEVNIIGNTLKDFLIEKDVDAVICTDEDSSYAVLKELKKNGKKIPEEVSIVGYLDEKIAENLTPEITTINQHRKTIGETAAKMLIKQIENNKLELKKNKISSTLNIRSSL